MSDSEVYEQFPVDEHGRRHGQSDNPADVGTYQPGPQREHGLTKSRAERLEAAVQEWAEAWEATHGLTFTGTGPFPEIERRDRAEHVLAALARQARTASRAT